MVWGKEREKLVGERRGAAWTRSTPSLSSHLIFTRHPNSLLSSPRPQAPPSRTTTSENTSAAAPVTSFAAAWRVRARQPPCWRRQRLNWRCGSGRVSFTAYTIGRSARSWRLGRPVGGGGRACRAKRARDGGRAFWSWPGRKRRLPHSQLASQLVRGRCFHSTRPTTTKKLSPPPPFAAVMLRPRQPARPPTARLMAQAQKVVDTRLVVAALMGAIIDRVLRKVRLRGGVKRERRAPLPRRFVSARTALSGTRRVRLSRPSPDTKVTLWRQQ